MSNIVLNSEDFGLNIYNRFPECYIQDDAKNNFALKRYIQALTEGGFKYTIDEYNGLLDMVDPKKTPKSILPYLYKQYGFDLFYGIPDTFLRYFLPRLGEAYALKGTLEVIPFIVSSLSGIQTRVEVTLNPDDTPSLAVDLDVYLSMDYNEAGYFPNPDQLRRIVDSFIPFYVDSTIIYAYVSNEEVGLHVIDYWFDKIFSTSTESFMLTSGIQFLPLLNEEDITLNDNFDLNKANNLPYGIDTFADKISYSYIDMVELEIADTLSGQSIVIGVDLLGVRVDASTVNLADLKENEEFHYLSLLNGAENVNRDFNVNKSNAEGGDLRAEDSFDDVILYV